MNKKRNFFSSLIVVELLFLITGITIVSLKFFFWDYSFEKLIPEVIYEFHVSIDYESVNELLEISTFLPFNNSRQSIMQEYQDNGGLKFSSNYTEDGRKVRWYSTVPKKHRGQIVYKATLNSKRVVYELPDSLNLPDKYSVELEKYLAATPTVQSTHPLVAALYQRIVGNERNVRVTIQKIYDHVASFRSLPFKGVTDAVTALKLEEASCNGKSRLIVALARHGKIPARLVGGIVLNSGNKKISHQWLELYLNGHWVPFDALNGHFAEIPKNYLTLYYDDMALFTHTPDMTFNYNFKIRKKRTVGKYFREELSQNPFNAYKVWEVFEKLGLPLGLLQIILMIPLGAFVITIFRNVIGLETFGTFLPALIAAASRETGLVWGLIGFLMVVAIVALLHYPLEKWRILHNPKMGILMIVVVNSILAFAFIGYKMGFNDISYISLFPIAVLTITSERCSQMITEQGIIKAAKVMIMTLIVISAAFFAMNSLAIQSLFLAFPELFMVLIVLNLWIGKWIGLRLTEFWRFRWLLNH